MNNKILTLSIAAYNVEKFIEKTLNSCTSISKEALEKLEILVVDDGSKDNTTYIAKSFESKFPQSIRCILKQNGGHGSTVNYSMSNAVGKYFMLLDGDDWMDSKQLEKLVNLLENEKSDMVLCPYNMVDNQSNEVSLINPNQLFDTGLLYETKDVLEFVKIYLAGMIIKTSILQEHPFKLQENCFYVDMEYVTFPIPYVKSIIFYDLVVYQCRTALHGQSTSSIGTFLHADDHFKVAKSLIDFYTLNKKSDPVLTQYLFNVTKKVIEDVFLMPFVFPVFDRNIRKRICDFNDYLKINDMDHYSARYRKKINFMRKTNYIGWQLFKVF